MSGRDEPASNPYLRAWLALFGGCARYFRFECEGFEHLRGPAALLVGYHGRPFPLDVFMLSVRVHAELGYMLPAVWLRAWGEVPVLRDMVAALDGFLGEPSPAALRSLAREGRHLVVLPGGTREALRPFWRRHRVDWGDRHGYLRLALASGRPIIPLAASGVDDAWLGLVDGYRLSKRLFGHGGVPVWLALGPLGLWPLSPPWPVKVRQRVGAPIELDALRTPGQSEEEFLRAAHAHVTGVVQAMLDELHRG